MFAHRPGAHKAWAPWRWSPRAEAHHASPVGAIIPLLLALLILQLHRGHGPAPTASPLPALAIVLAAWAVLAEVTARLAANGGRRWLRRWEHAAQAGCLGAFLWLCREQGWASWAPAWTVALAPWLAMQLLLWSSQAPALRRCGMAAWSRGGHILHHLRFELAPMLIVLPVIDLCEWAGARLGTLAWFDGGAGLLLSLLGGWLLVIALMAVLPSILALLWGARRLPDDALGRRLHEDCARGGLGDIALRQWRSPGGAVHNALAIGIIPRLRWIMVSDDLLRDLPPDQVRAVVGHEAGHHRHRHLMLYMWFALCAMLLKWWLLGILLGTTDAAGRPLSIPFGFDGGPSTGLVFAIPGIDRLPSDLVLGATMALAVLAVWRVVFGYISRACEREADIAGAETSGSESMAAALQTVARLSGTPDDAPSWRHHPIRERVRFLNALARDPGLAAHHRRFVRDMRLAIIALLALLAVVAAGQWMDPVRAAAQDPDPAATLKTWTDADAGLSSALQGADAGDTGPLIAWLAKAPAGDRQRLAILHQKLCEVGEKTKDGSQLPPDDRVPWRLRFRFAALAAVPMEDEFGLGAAVDNTYAYALVAGNARPSPQDIDQAKALLPRLEASVQRSPQHVILDTIGCVRFATRDWDGARRAWEDALAQLAKDRRIDPTIKAQSDGLYRRRLEDAKHNLAVAAGSRPGPFKPLHLSFTE